MGANGDLGYIHDGYTRDGYIAAVKGVHPELRFTYRMATVVQHAAMGKALDTAPTAEKGEEYGAKLIMQLVSSWDLVDHQGKPVPLEVPHILRLPVRLYRKLQRITNGLEPSDPDPNQTEEERTVNLDAEFEAAMTGRPIQEVMAGNSDEG